MTYAKMGDTVRVHYIGTLPDGTVFDTSEQREPLEFKVGEGKLIPGFEQALIGMQPGMAKTQTVPADMAYGPRMKELVREFNRDDLPTEFELEVGQQLQFQLPGDNTLAVTVIDVSGDTITLDANHPLAGEDLQFEIRLLEIV